MGEGARPTPPQGLVSKVFDFESSPPSPLTSNDDLRTHSETNSSSNPLTHSPSISIESDHEKSNFDETPVHFDEKALETYLMSAASHLKTTSVLLLFKLKPYLNLHFQDLNLHRG